MSALEQQFLGSCPVVVSYAVASASATPDSPFCATATLTNNQQVRRRTAHLGTKHQVFQLSSIAHECS